MATNNSIPFITEQTPLLSGRRTAVASPQQLYAHLVVPPGSNLIRLLDLDAAPSGEHALVVPLTGRLRVGCLTDRPKFTTLSYVWGDKVSPCPTLVILPHAVHLEISANCLHALRMIRKQFGAVTIWVDAVCINQDDIHEKESQIPLLQSIYSSARVGYVWLGESNRGLDLAANRLKRRAATLRRLSLDCLRARSRRKQMWELVKYTWKLWMDVTCKRTSCNEPGRRLPISQRAVSVTKSTILEECNTLAGSPGYSGHTGYIRNRLHIDQDDLDQMQPLLGSPWISRAWTFQELVLSDNPVLLSGDNIILWEDVINTAALANTTASQNTTLVPWGSLVSILLNLPQPSLRVAGDVEASKQPRSFREVLQSSKIPSLAIATLMPLFLIIMTPLILLILLPVLAWVAGLSMLSPSSFLFCELLDLALSGAPVFLSVIIWMPVSVVISFARFYFFGMYSPSDRWSLLHSGTEIGYWKYRPRAERLFLPAIWTALLERTSSDSCDKVFALFGILGANEIALSQSDYSRSLRDTYLIFFQDLLFSDPAFVTLLLSAVIWGRKQGWPSWLPNWSALERDAWLVSRYRLNLGGYWHKPHFLVTQPPTVSGSNLTLRGSSIGTLGYIVRFGPLSDKDDHSQLVTTLRHLAEWIWSVTSGGAPDIGVALNASQDMSVSRIMVDSWSSRRLGTGNIGQENCSRGHTL